MNAIISPTCMRPMSIPFAPIHTISTVIAFIMSIIAGIIMDMTRLVKSCVDISSLFALSNLSSSCFSLLNALMTIVPVSISRDTKFTRSTRLCILLNLGMATTISTSTSESTAPTATPIIQPIPVSVPITFMIPPIPIIGAYRTILSIMTDTCCTCCTSLVLLVIREAVENLFISALENPITLVKSFSLRSRPIAAAVFAPINPTPIAAATMRSVIASILAPVIRR